jgi:hypothetical protein
MFFAAPQLPVSPPVHMGGENPIHAGNGSAAHWPQQKRERTLRGRFEGQFFGAQIPRIKPKKNYPAHPEMWLRKCPPNVAVAQSLRLHPQAPFSIKNGH